MTKSWLFLASAISFEIVGTSLLKLSSSLSRLLPSIGMIIAYVCAFLCMSQALREIPVSVAYAIWSGVGTALVAVIGFLFFREPLGFIKVVSILFIIAGVVGLNLGR